VKCRAKGGQRNGAGNCHERVARRARARCIARELEPLSADRQHEEGDPPGNRHRHGLPQEQRDVSDQPAGCSCTQRRRLQRRLTVDDLRVRRDQYESAHCHQRKPGARHAGEECQATEAGRERRTVGPEFCERYRAL